MDSLPGHSAFIVTGEGTDQFLQIKMFSGDREKPKLDRSHKIKVPQSVSCHAGGTIWLYSESYGDASDAQIKINVVGLANRFLGAGTGSFFKNVTAAWVGKA